MEKKFCSQCGNHYDPQDLFCRNCGCFLKGTIASRKIAKSESLLRAERHQIEASKELTDISKQEQENEYIEADSLQQQDAIEHKDYSSSKLLSAVMFGIAANKLFG